MWDVIQAEKKFHPTSTVDSNYPGTVPKIRISNSPSSSINTSKSLVANSAKKTAVV